MTFRTIAEFEALTGDDAPTPAETALIAACRAGETCFLGDGKRPETDSDACRIRASLLRHLIVGGSNGCGMSKRGVTLWGGWIDGELNLDFATGCGLTNLVFCHLTRQPQMSAAKLGNLNLSGSKLPGLFAQGIEVVQSVILSSNFHATETVDLSGAVIGGQLDCESGWFDGNGKKALNGQRVKVAESVFLREGFHATGTVVLSGGDIGGQLDCTNGQFDGNNEMALNAQKIRVKAGFLWRNVTITNGAVTLNGAHVSDLADDLASWPSGSNSLDLDGFTYSRIVTFADTPQRLEWLRRGTVWNGKFYPQPYVQLASTLRAQGHDREASRVAFEGEKQSRQHKRNQMRIIPNGDVDVGLKSLWVDLKRSGLAAWDCFLRNTVGYGLYPFRSVIALILLFVITTIPAHYAWEEGSMVPNSAPVLVSSGWLEVADTPNPAEIWSLTDPGRDWETFNRYAWAADLVIPIIDLGQTSAWAPSTERGWWGANLWWARWLLIMAGWIVTALGAAAITGIIRRE